LNAGIDERLERARRVASLIKRAMEGDRDIDGTGDEAAQRRHVDLVRRRQRADDDAVRPGGNDAFDVAVRRVDLAGIVDE